MKRIQYFFLIASLIVLVTASVMIGRASALPMAATGCFTDTNGHWAEQFICWMKINGISGGYPDGTYKPANNVTRAELSVMLQKQVQIPPETGDTLISVGPTGWMPIAEALGGNNYVYYSSNSAKMRTNVVGAKQFFATVNAPVAMYGRLTTFKGAKLCYTATSQAQLAVATVMTVSNENNGQGTPASSIVDNVVRQNEACNTYLISSPVNMSFGEHVAIVLTINFTDIAADFKVSSVTFIFGPSTTKTTTITAGIASPEEAQQPIMPLSDFPEWFGLDQGD